MVGVTPSGPAPEPVVPAPGHVAPLVALVLTGANIVACAPPDTRPISTAAAPLASPPLLRFPRADCTSETATQAPSASLQMLL